MTEVSSKILSYLNNLYGEQSAKRYIDFINAEPAMYIRVNRLKTTPSDLTGLLEQNYSIHSELIPSIPNALRITSGNELVSKTIEHITGQYYMQGLSSMLPPLVLNPSGNDTIMDLCSAPGSKTTGIGELMDNKGTLVANEIALARVKMLVYNIDRMNLINAGVIHSKGEILSKIYSDYFDKILVDAPCSGLGIIQKKEEVNEWWSLERAESLGELQMRLLVAAVKMVKEGGEIIYSTCTLTPEENEFVINKIINKYPVEIEDIQLPVPSRQAFTSYNGIELHNSLAKAHRVIPWEVNSDGFFIVKLRKTGAISSMEKTDISRRDIRLLKRGNKEIKNFTSNIITDFGIDEDILSDYKYIMKNGDIFFLSSDWHDEYPGFFERIGTKFGTIDRNGKTVLHTQAAQVLEKFIKNKIYTIEDQNDLKLYLDGAVIKKQPGFTGQCVVKYQNHLLGSAVVTEAGIKSRFPRAKRTQEIMTEF